LGYRRVVRRSLLLTFLALFGCAPPLADRKTVPNVDHTVYTNRWRFKKCLDRALVQDENAGGTTRVQVIVDRDGSVSSATIAFTDAKPELSSCVRDAFKPMRFNRPTAGRATFVVPIALSVKRGSAADGAPCQHIPEGVEACGARSIDDRMLRWLSVRDPAKIAFVFDSESTNEHVATAARWTAARSIFVPSAYVTDLRALSSLKQLETLVVWKTNVTDVSFVRGLPNLHRLELPPTANAAPAFDVPSLTELGFWGTLSDWTPIARLPHLEKLTVLKTAINEVRTLPPAAPHLRSLAVADAPNLVDATPLSAMRDLTEVRLTGTAVTSIAALKTLDKLEVVDLTKSPITDLSPLAAHAHLREVRLGGTKVHDLWPLMASARSLKQLIVPAHIPDSALASFTAANPALRPIRE
jgi:hypothetical protein